MYPFCIEYVLIFERREWLVSSVGGDGKETVRRGR
jgi:hypothetical protein